MQQAFVLLSLIYQSAALLTTLVVGKLVQQALVLLAERDNIASELSGLAVRLLLDAQNWVMEQAAGHMRQALAKGVPIQDSSAWLQGFLYGSGLLLLHNPPLWALIDAWIQELSHVEFQQLLPALRKTFSSYAPAERQKMLQLAKDGRTRASKNRAPVVWDETRVQTVLPTLQLIFGKG